VEDLGWRNFFLFCFLAAVPGMMLLLKVAPWSADGSEQLKSFQSA